MYINVLHIKKEGRLDPEFYSHQAPPGKEAIPLSCVADITLGTTPKTQASGEIPFYKVENIKKYNIENERWYTSVHIKKKKIAKKDDILVTVKGRIGDAAILDRNAFYNQDIARIVAKKIHPLLLLAILNSGDVRRKMEKVATNQMHPYIRLQDLKKIKIKIPEKNVSKKIIETTKKIVTIQSKLKKIENSIEQIFTTDTQSVSSHIPVKKLKNVSRLDAEYFVIYKRRSHKKHMQIKDLPKISLRVGLYKKEFVKKGTPYIRSTDIKNGKVTPQLFVAFNKKEVTQANEILLTRVGNSKAIHIHREKYIPSDNFLRIRFEENGISSQAMTTFLNSTAGKDELKRHMQGSKQRRINKKSLMDIHIPHLEKSKEKKVRNYIQKISALKEKKERLGKEVEQLYSSHHPRFGKSVTDSQSFWAEKN